MFLITAAPERRTRAYRLDDMVVLAGAYHTGGCWGENVERQTAASVLYLAHAVAASHGKAHLDGQLTGYMY